MSKNSNKTNLFQADLSRRQFVLGASSAMALSALPITASGKSNKAHLQNSVETLSGNHFKLNIGYKEVNFTGRKRTAVAVNSSIPSPILRFKQGQRVKLDVTNNLAVDSSLHWHGLILPTEMDGVPGLSFAGIKPGATFQYEFDINQSGTYWYHSHSGFQEQQGMYGAIVIDPAEPDPVAFDREYVVLLSDWSDEDPNAIYANLKKMSHIYNNRERTAGDLWREIKQNGVKDTFDERAMWNNMRMSDTDISDVTGATYTYLMNGNTPEQGWRGLFKRGEKIRLRFINAAAMSIFDVRIPGLQMTVVASDGQNIEPVTVDEFRMGVAETYDVIVEPKDDRAYSLFAQTIDRSGFARGSLTPDLSVEATPPLMDPPPVLSHRDMGMDHSMHMMTGQSDHKMDHSKHNMKKMDHANHKMMDHSAHQGHQMKPSLGKAGHGSTSKIIHASSEFGPHVDMRSEVPQSGITDPGVGLRQHKERYGRKVLNYGDVCNLYPTLDKREPSREIQLHLTGNMSRYMWSINGTKYADAEPLNLTYGERVRITLVNDTMMTHPMHLHGMWSELETGEPGYIPRKHTVLVQPGSKVSYLVTADALGRWAYHCHLIYHMAGMMREVRVTK